MNAGDCGSVFLLQFLDSLGIHEQGGLGLAVIELGPPDLSLRLERVEEVLGPVHVVAGG